MINLKMSSLLGFDQHFSKIWYYPNSYIFLFFGGGRGGGILCVNRLLDSDSNSVVVSDEGVKMVSHITNTQALTHVRL